MTLLRGRQGTVFNYRFICYSPIEGTNKPDKQTPYVFEEGHVARFTVMTPDAYVVTSEGPEITLLGQTGEILVRISALETATWPTGYLHYELEMTPPNGESEKYALVYGTVLIEERYA